MDIDRVKRFRERFAEFDRNDNLPQFIVLRIGNVHTSATRAGKKTPTAMVADNDLPGTIVEIISHSRYWKSLLFLWLKTTRKMDRITSTRTALWRWPSALTFARHRRFDSV